MDLEKALADLDKLTQAKIHAHETYTKAVEAEHAKIREILATFPWGIRTRLVEHTGYTPSHLDRIRKGKTSGNTPPGDPGT
ncbi:hypothetical protein [Nocardia otitidiscaviarum]|uniref:hypothetical protein n=1 Tax=Nocardia otitidiscaviarum TaxID=1823 RepID=UPI0004A6CDFE|nr:hypothetical protein [Nocardia otitidiscaviarum]